MPTRKNVDSITRINSFSNTPISREGLKSLTLKPHIKKSFYHKLTSSFLIFAMLFQVIGGVFCVPVEEVKAANAFFSDNFSNGSSNWTPTSGAWINEDGQYKNKEIGQPYISSSAAPIFQDDFSTPSPVLTTTATPFTDDFTEPDGVASQWTAKRGTFGVSGNEYVATAGSSTLSVLSNSGSENWTDYSCNK